MVTVAALALTGCAAAFAPPAPDDGLGQYEVVLDRPFDDVWDGLVDYSSRTFFGIDNVQRDSGLMTLSFGAEYPGDFVDCGTVENAGEPLSTIDYFLLPVVGGPQDITEFTGRMNILVQEIDIDRTRVRVNARYVLTYISQVFSVRETWAFSTGESDTESLSANQEITCQPTYYAERSVLVDGLGAQI